MSLVSNLATFLNRSPVPQAPRETRDVFNVFTGGRQTTPEGMKRGMEQYTTVSTAYGIISRLAESTAMVDWHLYRKQTDGRRVYREVETRTEVTKHAFLDLMAKPNPLMDGAELAETLIQHYDTCGEYWLVAAYGSIRAAGPIELWPMRPDRVRIITDPYDALVGYIYVGPDGEQVPLEKEIVFQGRHPNPLDIYRGLGPMQALSIKLESNKLQAEYNRNFFLNSAEPGGIIEIEDRLDDDEFRELAARWREQHQGVANAHRVAILEQGKWVERKFSMKDMAFPELAEANREDIREAFGYPKGMTGATEDVNKAVADANERMFGRYLLRPRLKQAPGHLRRGPQAVRADRPEPGVRLHGPGAGGPRGGLPGPDHEGAVSEAVRRGGHGLGRARWRSSACRRSSRTRRSSRWLRRPTSWP